MTLRRPLLTVLCCVLALAWVAPAGAGVRLSARDEPVAAVRSPAAGARVTAPLSAPHRFNLVRTSDVGWWVLDSAFVLGTRGVYQVGPEDAGFYGMEL